MIVSVLVVFLHDGEADWELLLSIITYHILLAQEKINIQRMISTFFFLLVSVQISKHHLLKGLSFQHCVVLPPLS